MSTDLRKRIDALLVPMPYMYNGDFDDAALEDSIMAAMPGELLPPMEAPKGVSSSIQRMCEHGLMNREQEVHLFRQMNFLKHRFAMLQAALTAESSLEQVLRAERCKFAAQRVRNFIIEHNLRLVVSVCRRLWRPGVVMEELVSDANMPLMRAVDKFDYALGFKFATYATWAIQKDSWRKRSTRECNGIEELENVAPPRRWKDDAAPMPSDESDQSARLAGLTKGLSERERIILSDRIMAHSDDQQTLERLAKRFGLTKERVRQIEAALLVKLRERAEEAGGADYFMS
jgi:RNA polymerase primary sigma factor